MSENSSNKVKLKFTASLELKVSKEPIKFLLKASERFDFLTGTLTSTESLQLKAFVNIIEPNLGDSIPDELKITLNKLFLLIYGSKEQATKYLICLDLGTSINLSNLPLVGKEFAGSQTIAINDFKIIYVSGDFKNIIKDVSELQNIHKLYKGNIPEGIQLNSAMQFGETIETLNVSISGQKDKQKGKTLEPSASVNSIPQASLASESSVNQPQANPLQSSDTVKWYELKKHFGPLYFSRIGVQYEKSEVWFFLDASISAAGLTLTLDGLAIGSPITQFKPKLNLRGVGIEYDSKGVLSIGGALLRTTTIDDKGIAKDSYDGAVLVKTEAFTLSAIASYTTTDDGHPSLFVYGVLDKPLGGSPCFFVTGLAFGFAYNRTLILPTLDEIPKFPLIRAAMGEQNVKELTEIQRALKPYTPPRVGQILLLIGVKFTSFKIIDSFILLIATFSDQLSLDVIGISTLVSPPALPVGSKIPPIAQIRLAIRSRFVPAEGALKVDGKILPDSFLFERNCQISGSFAFYSWFKDQNFVAADGSNKTIYAGDFVLTVGGYHPSFVIPEHYPKVDPISLNWRLNDQLTIKGSVYFALTASAIMAGGRLEAVWQSENLKAWYIANANFIVAWEPYFYEAQINVNVGASYTFDEKIFGIRVRKTLSFDIGANIHIWGPEFSGTATVDLKIVSFMIAFGSRTQNKPDPISWGGFKQSFLPDHKQVCTISVENGLLRKSGNSEVVIVNPRYFTLTATSVIPIQETANQQVGIAPMGVTKQNFTSEFTFKLNGQDNIDSYFNRIPIYKNVPSGLWAESNSNNPNQSLFIEKVLSGFTIQPKQQSKLGEIQPIDREKLAYDQTSVDREDQWKMFSAFKKNEMEDENTRQNKIRTTINNVSNNRNKLLQRLGLTDMKIDLDDFNTDEGAEQAFVISPQLQLA